MSLAPKLRSLAPNGSRRGKRPRGGPPCGEEPARGDFPGEAHFELVTVTGSSVLSFKHGRKGVEKEMDMEIPVMKRLPGAIAQGVHILFDQSR